MTITIVAVLLGILSVAAGAAKVMLVPEEVTFLGRFGFTSTLIVAFGALQIVGGLLISIPITRLYGALLAGLAFTVSTVLLVLERNFAFGAISLLPVILSGLIAYYSFQHRTGRGSGR